MKRIKSVIGILLIILSIVSLFLWEWKGREMILLREVLVARNAIEKGTLVDESMFESRGVPKDNLIEGALEPKDVAILKGKVSAQMIAGNGQVSRAYFIENAFYLKEGEAIFVIEPGWIAMRSSSLRRGDIVDIYAGNGGGLIGSYRVAFVKDEAEREVRDTMIEGKTFIEKEILERTDSTSVIDHIEIITTLGEYEKLVSYVKSASADGTSEVLPGDSSVTPPVLILVQGGEKIDS
ncbi:MAG: hypothetical protein K0R19_1027 [Bacillota bacterium]|nr:hypothetical protein [Bacillota bacterium]